MPSGAAPDGAMSKYNRLLKNVLGWFGMNPDSAVAIDAKSEEQAFHSEANRLCL